MTQMPLQFSRLHTALIFIAFKPDAFRPEFHTWLSDNFFLYEAFEREANRVATRRAHWSANTVIEYLRHETMLRDVSSEWKLDDRWVSSIARLYALMNPGHRDLFEYRTRKDGVVKAA